MRIPNVWRQATSTRLMYPLPKEDHARYLLTVLERELVYYAGSGQYAEYHAWLTNYVADRKLRKLLTGEDV